MNQKPTQKVKWPNVALTSLPQFEKSLDSWFGRKNIPIWISEYGNETKPGEPKGVTEAQQAAYIPQAIAIAKKDARVPMFIWFVMQDSKGSLWQSGIYRNNGSTKPGQPKWAAAAKPLSPVNGKVSIKGGTKNPSLTVYLRSFCATNPIGETIGSHSVRPSAASSSPSPSPRRRSPSTARSHTRVTGLTVLKGKTYTVTIDANTRTGAAPSGRSPSSGRTWSERSSIPGARHSRPGQLR